jgi:predicted dehydrogenase
MNVCAAIAGAGLMGYWHAKALTQVGGRVSAVFDLNLAAAQKLAAKFTGAQACDNFGELLGQQKIDVLHICTPTASHFELAASALKRGVHVLVEKPLTPTAEESEALHDLAAERGLQLCPVHQFPFQSGVLELQRRLGELGDILHVQAQFCSAGAVGKRDDEVDTIVADILPHPLSLMQSLLPGRIAAANWTVLRSGLGEFQAVSAEAGTTFSIVVSMNTRPTSTTLRLLGSKGTAHVDLFHGFAVFEPGAVSRWRKIAHPFDLAGRTLVGASGNLLARAFRSEAAYPGLRSLIGGFYTALSGKGACPISRTDASVVANVRDRLVAQFAAAEDVHALRGGSS